MKKLVVGIAVLGAASFGFVGSASANHTMDDPQFVADVVIGCNDMGYHMSDCAELVEDTWEAAIIGEVAAAVAGLGYTLEHSDY